jgi:arylformamidase
MIYDISRTLHPRLAVWPGDTHYTVEHRLRLHAGDSVNLTTLTLSAHTGTHTDAYYHYQADGAHPAGMPLDAYIGPARVITVHRQAGALLPSDLPASVFEGAERLLIRSHVSDQPDDRFVTAFPYLSLDLIGVLAAHSIRLIGLDAPSVDAFDSHDLPCHHALYAHRIVNLENLLLKDVADGDYELIALPLKLDLACGSPVRALLRSL